MMKTKAMIWSVAAMFLATAISTTAYHIDDDSADPDNDIATKWVGTTGLVIVLCESKGPDDPVNPSDVPQGGIGGICYASSQSFWNKTTLMWDKTAKDAKKNTTAENQPVWSSVEPICDPRPHPTPGGPNTGPTSGGDWLPGAPIATLAAAGIGNCPVDDPSAAMPTPLVPGPVARNVVGEDWFARVGTNAHSCSGLWGPSSGDINAGADEFVYKEMLAYFHGTAPNPNGASGHVTFFVDDPDTAGHYNAEKDVAEPPTKCTSKFVGLS